MFTKYQMNRFIDFLPKLVVRLAAIVGDHRCRTPRHWFKETLYEFLGYIRPSNFHMFPKLIWWCSWGCKLGQSLSISGPHIFYRRNIQRASRQGKKFNLAINEELLYNACHVCSLIILLKYSCGQALNVRKDN